MARYKLQEQQGGIDSDSWVDTDLTFNTKEELHNFINDSGYNWRVGFLFKPYDKPPQRFAWNVGRKEGELVKC